MEDFCYWLLAKYPFRSILIVFAMALAGCTPEAVPLADPISKLDIPFNEMNKEIILKETPGMMDAYKVSGLIFLDIMNLSNSAVSFPPDYGSKIFIKTENEWQEITNKFSYSDAPIILPTNKQHPLGLSLSVFPDIPEQSGPIVLRVIVIGKVVDSGESLGAYIDVIVETDEQVVMLSESTLMVNSCKV